MRVDVDQAGEDDRFAQISPRGFGMILQQECPRSDGPDAASLDKEGTVIDRRLIDREEVSGSENEHITLRARAGATTPRPGRTPPACSR